jgi:DNA processing protein
MIYWIALSLVEGAGLVSKHKLLEIFGAPEKIFEQKISKFDFPRIKEDIDFKNIKDFYLKSAENIICQCEKSKAEIICFDDKYYPEQLKIINGAPLLLYCKGDKKILSQKSVAIVGTREPNENGIKDTKEFSSGLTKGGFVISSGLARGVDSIAHHKSLENGGKTIAVMATGINEVTPVSNIGLAKQIIESGGAVITEQVPDKLAFAPNFVQRNRIIIGLAKCVVLTSAPEKSGALATVRFAEQQGKKIFVTPGRISENEYKGSNKLLLKENIDPALAVNDVLSFLNGTKKIEQLDMFYVPPKVSKPQVLANPIMQYLSKNPVSLENLSIKSGINTDELYETLFDLSFDGSIKQDISGNYYT